MEQMNCFFCNKTVENCGRRTNRRAESFEVTMMHGFEDGVAVPCKFREKLNSICQKNWMVVDCRGRCYDMYLRKSATSTVMCGPYWRSLVRVHNIELGNIVSFTFVEVNDLFECNVYELVNNRKQLKQHVGNAVLFDIPDDVRATLHNIVARSIPQITEVDMASIMLAIMKEVYEAPAQDLADWDFYVPAEEMQFILEKYTEENVNEDCLFFPAAAVAGLNITGFGPTRMYHKNINPFIECEYVINGDDETGVVTLQDGWEEVVEALHIVLGSIVVAKIHVRTNARIFLDFVEVINQPNNPANA